MTTRLRALALIVLCVPYMASAEGEEIRTMPWGERHKLITPNAQTEAGGEAIGEEVVEEVYDPVQTLKNVERYLNSIKTIKSEFSQVEPDGSLASGTMYLKRPGKMRWEYKPPTPVLMIADGKNLTYYDYELDQLNHLPLDGSLASFLVRPNIKLDDNALRIVNFREGADSIRFTILQTAKLDEGSLTLEFSRNPIRLRSMIITDAVGQATSIKLSNAKYDLPIEKSLFVFDNPREFRIRNYQR